jgi:high-affinity Fe2+/Pb2+ permease
MKQITNWYKSNIALPTASKNDKSALQSFAITMALAFPIVFMLALPWLLSNSTPMWPIYVSMLLSGLYIFAPALLYYPYIVWMFIASILGWINTRIILAIAYYLLVVPIGLFMQWRKGLEYKHQIQDDSAWTKRDKLPTKENLKDPF